MRIALPALLVLGARCGGPTGSDARPELLVFAASSLADALADLAAEFPRARLVPNLAGTQTLARQIRSGARADVFLAAAPQPVDGLIDLRLADPTTRRRFAGNSLVVVVPAGEDSGAASLEAASRIAIGDPDSVPAGIYARRALARSGRWERIADRLVPSASVRVALAHVESGAADAGIVYSTDAARSTRVRVLERIPESVDHVAVALAASPRPELARAFVEFLVSPAGAELLRRHGFEP